MMEKNWHKFPVLFSLYIAQSIPMSFFSTVVPVIMRQEGLSLASIGLVQLVKLPWILKFLWAPVVDRHTRSDKEIKMWIYVSEVFYAAVILIIAFFNLKTDFTLIIILMIVAFLVSATQDIAVDIYAILTLQPSERSLGNSMQSGGSFVGAFLGTGVLLMAYHYFGWTYLLVMLAAFVLIAVVPLRFSGNKVTVNQSLKIYVSMKDIYLFFKESGRYKHILILVFYYAGLLGTMTMLKPFLVDLGYNVKQIALMSGMFGTLVAALSAFSGGFIIRKAGRKLSLYIFALLSLIAAFYFRLLTMIVPTVSELYVGVGLLWSAYGFSTVAIYTIAMDAVRKGREGTDFTIQIVITHLVGLLAAAASGGIANNFGYSTLFTIEMAISVLTLLVLWYALPQKISDIKLKIKR